ncbi:hypothetical protein HHL11_27140 [Ramlibacter sp. G-1-2-2]|uniref:N-acetyltransferase domain-containing protein n=1 Tax=Ramlibacter agri TaxID=2728837 RepID=A0A848H9L1_9BURK|nr:hypothetical protein [Ramlibacter agri]NML47455.1 hypothetical protein [Ramlibacter agri]
MRPTMQIVATPDVPAPTWDELWQFSCRFYDAERAYVEARLKEHGELALYRDPGDGSLVGMAAIHVEPLEFRGRKLVVIFTSHAIVDERFRGHNLLQRAGARTYLRSCLRHPLRSKFWVFDTFSYRSYLLLTRNMHAFWPRRERATPEWEAAFMDHYGRLRYGEDWGEAGIVRRSPHKRLLPGTARVDADKLRNPDIAYYVEANPGHAEGDMLLCICPLNWANWWGILSRAAGRMWRRR